MKPNTSCIAFLFWVTGFMTAAVAGEMHRSPEEKLDALLNTSSTLAVNLVQKSKKSKITQKNAVNFLKAYPANKIFPA